MCNDNAKVKHLIGKIPWREVMGMRDIIVHHYFEIDAEVIFATVKESIPELLTIIQKIGKEL